MCLETLQIIQDGNMKTLEVQLAMQCAPVLAGVKISNLLNIDKNELSTLAILLRGTEIKIQWLCAGGEKVTLLLYREEDLEIYLNQPACKAFLQKEGYLCNSAMCVLREFSRRYSAYKEHEAEFPHEMGILLGYPVEDIIGFIENEGRNFAYSGYWKVYKNVAEAMSLFKDYDTAKKVALKLVANGQTILNMMGCMATHSVAELAV